MAETTPCLMCGRTLKWETSPSSFIAEHLVRCKLCGQYRISRKLASIPLVPQDLKPYLSIATREASEAGVPILLDTSNLEETAEPHRSVTVSQQVDSVLRFVASKCRQPGLTASVDPQDDYRLEGV